MPESTAEQGIMIPVSPSRRFRAPAPGANLPWNAARTPECPGNGPRTPMPESTAEQAERIGAALTAGDHDSGFAFTPI
jgi:hypothetical protein